MNLHELILSNARKTPDNVAIRHAGTSMTYAELDSWSNRIAFKLLRMGVGPQDRVAVWAEKSPWVVAAFQAILRLGAAYVPLDPMSPPLRARSTMSDCKVRALITTQDRSQISSLPTLLLDGEGPNTLESLSSLQNQELPPQDISGSTLAYILYTSGSTGLPKGICLSHGNAMSFVNWAAQLLETKSSDRFSNHAPFHFDLSVLDLYVPFSKGASVSLIPEGLAYSPRKLTEFIQSEQITHWYSVPSALILMMEHGKLAERRIDTLKAVLFAGEPFPIKHLRQLQMILPKTRLLNLYGPTETNVCTAHEVDEIRPDQTSPVSIGKVCCGNEAWVIGPDGARVTTPGSEGELIIRGPTVMLGYWGKPPVSDQTYSTGDIVRLLEDGSFHFVGRRDHQVKIKGYRVDLGEVEATLLSSPDVSEAAVIIQGSGLKARLIACVVAKNGKRPELLDLKQMCAQTLPSYMIIDRLKLFTDFPRTATGKLDRKTLNTLITEERMSKNAA